MASRRARTARQDRTAAQDAFVHEAVYYTNIEEYLAITRSLIRAGLTAGEAVLVAVPEPKLSELGRALGADRNPVRFVDMAEVGRNPNRIIPGVLAAFVQEHRPRRVRIIGEPIFVGRTAEEIGPCVQHEALINAAFAGVGLTILCLYDVKQMPFAVPDAEHTHPVIVEGDGQRRPGEYLDPLAVVAMHNSRLPEPRDIDQALVFDVPRLVGLRRVVAEHATKAGLPSERVEHAQIAVNEIATNALTHGGPAIATLRAWSDPARVIYEIRGAGRITDPMAGRVVPPPEMPHGRGLLIANRLSDLIQTHTTPAGTVTRVHLRRPRP